MKLMSICFIFSLFISPIFGYIQFNLDFTYQQPTFNIQMNNSNIRDLFTTEAINPNYSIAITPKDKCQKLEFCYPYQISRESNFSNETITVGSVKEEGFLLKYNSIYIDNYLSYMNLIYGGSFYGGVVSFDEKFISYLYNSKKIYDKTISIVNQYYYNYNHTRVEEARVRIGSKRYIDNYTFYSYSESKTIEIKEIDFAVDNREFRRNSLSLKEYKDYNFSIEFYHSLDSDSIYGPSKIIDPLVNLLKQNNFTCNEINNAIICNSSIYYGFFKVNSLGYFNSYGIPFNHLKFQKSEDRNNLIFGIKTIESLNFYYNYGNKILSLESRYYDKGIIRQNNGKDYSKALTYLLSFGVSFLFGGVFIP